MRINILPRAKFEISFELVKGGHGQKKIQSRATGRLLSQIRQAGKPCRLQAKGKAVKAPEIKPSSTAFPSNHILMVRAGLENQWEPTCEELDAIAGLFLQALDNPGSVVVVRNGIEAWWIEQPAAKKTMIQSKGKK